MVWPVFSARRLCHADEACLAARGIRPYAWARYWPGRGLVLEDVTCLIVVLLKKASDVGGAEIESIPETDLFF